MNTNICPSCQTHNRPEANFCVACGRKLLADNRRPSGAIHDRATGVRESFNALPPFKSVPKENWSQLVRLQGPELRIGYQTDVGQVRQLNEDSFLALSLGHRHRAQSRSLGFFAVADGMGGHEGGEIASGLLVQVMARHMLDSFLVDEGLDDNPVTDFATSLREAIQAGNRTVFEWARRAGNNMGTTVVAALVVDGEAYIAHVGDSRAYLLDDGGLRRLTADHSLVEQLVTSGEISPQQARHHPHANVITRTIGASPIVEIELSRISFNPGDTILLCSDGLNGMLDDEQIEKLVITAGSPQMACEALVRAANESGGDDNITVIVVQPESSV